MAQDVYAVASDLVPSTSLIRLVYDSPMVMKFLAAVVNQPQIYQYGDEFQVCVTRHVFFFFFIPSTL